MTPHWLPQIELNTLPDASLWTIALSWIDPDTGHNGYVTIHEQPSARAALAVLDALLPTIPWPWLDAPGIYPHLTLILPESLHQHPQILRSILRHARHRHWAVDFQPFVTIPLD
jgi:hypothetical protein